MDGEELRRRYAAGERDFTGIDLKGINVSGIDPDLDRELRNMCISAGRFV